MNLRIIGGVLLIAGTSIGGGMLALPIANAQTGFWPSTLVLILCWFVMLLGALFILEVNLYLPRGKNMISMAAETLGLPGLTVTWFAYLFLLYTLLAAYISGGSDVLGYIFLHIGIALKPWQASVLFTVLFGLIAYGGIRRVDLANRALMFAKLGAYCILVLFIAPKIQPSHFDLSQIRYATATLMILITSFGFSIIVPNLRDYFDDNIVLLKKVIITGSLVPLLCYIAWDAVILGTLPLDGKEGLLGLMQSQHATSDLAVLLAIQVKNGFISSLFNFFTAICMLTAFLGVSLCLISFLSDGIKMDTFGYQGLGLVSLTFIPPLAIVIFYPGAYIQALNYAGILCVILLLLLPVCMSIFGRKRLAARYVVPGGFLCQGVVVVVSLLLLMVALMPFF